MATPSLIPVDSKRNQHSGPLGIMNNVMARTTELEAMPKRQGRDHQYMFQPPTYTDSEGVTRAFVWCRGCENKLFKLAQQGSRPKWTAWRKRDEFYVDRSRPTERLQRLCKTCMKDYVTMKRQARSVVAA